MTDNTDIKLLSEVLSKGVGKVELTPSWGWPGNPALCVLDCVLSLNRNYDSFLLPRLRNFKEAHPEMVSLSDLQELISSYSAQGLGAFLEVELDYKYPDVEQRVVGVLTYLQGVANPEDEWSSLHEWAIESKPSDYLNLHIKGFGIAGFQYLRMLFGAQTVKPDVHILRFVSEVLNRNVTEIESVWLLEQAAQKAGMPIREADNEIWKQAAGSER